MVGWVTFASVMLGLAGIWNSIAGILAISSSGSIRIMRSSSSATSTPGAGSCVLGIIQLIAAGCTLRRQRVRPLVRDRGGRSERVGQLLFLPAYPWWAIAMFAVDILVIYGLAVYAGSRMRAV